VSCWSYIFGHVGPSYGPPCHSYSAIEHEIPESHHYDSLCEGVTIALFKPDFLLAKLDLILVGTQN
jgi:hypothetical protein